MFDRLEGCFEVRIVLSVLVMGHHPCIDLEAVAIARNEQVSTKLLLGALPCFGRRTSRDQMVQRKVCGVCLLCDGACILRCRVRPPMMSHAGLELCRGGVRVAARHSFEIDGFME